MKKKRNRNGVNIKLLLLLLLLLSIIITTLKKWHETASSKNDCPTTSGQICFEKYKYLIAHDMMIMLVYAAWHICQY